MANSQSLSLLVSLTLSMSLCSMLDISSAYADKTGKAAPEGQFSVPEPDELPEPPLPEEHVFPVREVMLLSTSPTSGVRGIDVSHYQGKINWELVASDQDVNYVYIKATESVSLVDDCYRENLEGAREAGIPVGSYHFFSPSSSAYTQFRNFSETVDPRTQDLVPIVDVEKRGKSSLRVFKTQLKTFLTEVEKLYGVKPIIYTGVNFYNKYLLGDFLDYYFMIARYVEEPPELFDDARIVMWQYTSQGSVQGIRGHVDQSCFMGNYTLDHIRLRPQRKK